MQKYITDNYNQQMKGQSMFTSTLPQFINNEYTLDSSVGLGDQSFMFVPNLPIVGNTIKGTSQIGKVGYEEAKYNFLLNPTVYTEGILDYATSALPYGTPALSGFGFATAAAFDYEGTLETLNKGVDLIKSIPIKIENNISNINGDSNGK